MESKSPKYKLDKVDWGKIGIGAAMAIIGSLLTYVTKVVGNIDWGTWTSLVMPAWSILANAVRKWVKSYN